MPSRSIVLLITVAINLLFGVSSLSAADDDKPSGEQTEARKNFESVFTEWKNVLDEMRRLRASAQEAENSELPDLKKRYAEQIAIGDTLLPKLRDTAIAVYKEAPGEDRSITNWLVSISRDHVSADRFLQAKPAVDVLVTGKTVIPEVYNLAGVIEFTEHNFEKAKENLVKAASSGALTQQGQQMLLVVDDYIKFWEEEKAKREAEAKAPEDKKLPRVRIETNRGVIVVELFEDDAPETVANFIHLVEKGFYDELTFHRVLDAFMAQGGCPEGDGRGGPGYSIYCECVGAEHRKHFTGSISMAHAGRDTGGSQFFITFAPAPQLNGKHTVFGRVVEGIEVLPDIRRRDPDKSGDLSITPDKIIKAEVLSKRDHKYIPNKVK